MTCRVAWCCDAGLSLIDNCPATFLQNIESRAGCGRISSHFDPQHLPLTGSTSLHTSCFRSRSKMTGDVQSQTRLAVLVDLVPMSLERFHRNHDLTLKDPWVSVFAPKHKTCF